MVVNGKMYSKFQQMTDEDFPYKIHPRAMVKGQLETRLFAGLSYPLTTIYMGIFYYLTFI